MTQLQWYFQYYALKKHEHDTAEATIKIFRQLMVNLLGLNLLRPTDANSMPKDEKDMSEEEKNSYIPLSLMVARPEIVKAITEQFEREEIGYDPKEAEDYEKLVAAIDAAGGDMDPILGINPEKEAERYQKLREKRLKSLGIKTKADLDILGDI